MDGGIYRGWHTQMGLGAALQHSPGPALALPWGRAMGMLTGMLMGMDGAHGVGEHPHPCQRAPTPGGLQRAAQPYPHPPGEVPGWEPRVPPVTPQSPPPPSLPAATTGPPSAEADDIIPSSCTRRSLGPFAESHPSPFPSKISSQTKEAGGRGGEGMGFWGRGVQTGLQPPHPSPPLPSSLALYFWVLSFPSSCDFRHKQAATPPPPPLIN